MKKTVGYTVELKALNAWVGGPAFNKELIVLIRTSYERPSGDEQTVDAKVRITLPSLINATEADAIRSMLLEALDYE